MSKLAKLLIPVGLGAVALFAMTGSASADDESPNKPRTKTPKTKGTNVSSLPPAEMLQRLADAMARGDFEEIRRIAAELDRAGHPQAASDARKVADAIEQAELARRIPGPDVGAGVPVSFPTPTSPRAPAPAPRAPVLPDFPIRSPGQPIQPAPLPRPIVVAPPVIRPAPQPAPRPITAPADPRKALALTTHRHLLTTPRGQEDRKLISAFQTQEGLKPSGVYGPGTGKAFIKYGLVPSVPRVWPQPEAPAKKDWRDNMLFSARQDPQRAEEWQQAAQV